MNFFTRPMRLLTSVVLEQTGDDVVKALLELGVMDFVHIDKLDPRQMEKLGSRPSAVSRVVLEDLRRRVEAMLDQGHQPLPSSDILDVKNLETPDIEGYRKFLDALGKKVSVLKDKQKESSQRLLGYDEMKRYISEEKWEYLDLRVGSITHGKVEDLVSRLSSMGGVVDRMDETTERCISLTLHRDGSQVTPLLDKFGWTETSDAVRQRQAISAISRRLDEEVRQISLERSEIEEQVSDLIKSDLSRLVTMWGNLRLNELCDQIRSYFSYTRNTTLFSGWVPADRADAVSKAIYDASAGQCVIEWTEPTQVPRQEVPVAVSAPKAIRPFQRIVDNYGTPEYGSVNPTLFVMVAYLLMFGLMFADVGQGFILLLVGILGLRGYRRHPMKKDGLISRNLCSLLLYLGASSMVFGALFGSYFGMSWLPAIWFNYDAAVTGTGGAGAYMGDVYDILGLTIKFGIVVIYTGLVINWINLFRKRAFLKLFLDKNGIAGGWLFSVGLYMAYGYVGSDYRSFPSAPWIAPAIVIPIVLLFVRGFLEYALSRKEGGGEKSFGAVFGTNFIDWFVDILEIFTGYLSNTLSFMRVAGLGIAHATLMEAFMDLSNMAGGGLAGFAIYVAGNALVIILEGLSSGIQSLRLNYYEFFSRYFTGKGIAYEPVGLRTPFSEKNIHA